MIDSLGIYNAALTFANNNPSTAVNYYGILREYYLQLVTTIFYELTVKKFSPMISVVCSKYGIGFSPKNFSLPPAHIPFNFPMRFDLYMIVYGLNVALSENLSSCSRVFDNYAIKIFRGTELTQEEFQYLYTNLTALDENLGKIFAVRIERVEVPVEKIIEVEKRVEVPVEKISDEQDKDLIQSLKALADNRHAENEKIIGEINKVQLALQDELPRLQNTLKTIADIRDGLEFHTLEEPINQLLQLFDMINDTAQRHPQEDRQKGYDNLIRRCRKFSDYVEQSLEMLGAKIIKETNILFDPSKHKATNTARPSNAAKVSKILSVGLIFKDLVLRKAEVELVEPAVISQENYLAIRKSFGR